MYAINLMKEKNPYSISNSLNMHPLTDTGKSGYESAYFQNTNYMYEFH